MATDRSTVTFIIEQLSKDGDVSAKPMFGEHGLYRDGKMFGMICEGQLSSIRPRCMATARPKP